MNLIAVHKNGAVYELRDAKRVGAAWDANYRLLRVNGGRWPTYTDWVRAEGRFPDIDYSFVRLPD